MAGPSEFDSLRCLINTKRTLFNNPELTDAMEYFYEIYEYRNMDRVSSDIKAVDLELLRINPGVEFFYPLFVSGEEDAYIVWGKLTGSKTAWRLIFSSKGIPERLVIDLKSELRMMVAEKLPDFIRAFRIFLEDNDGANKQWRD